MFLWNVFKINALFVNKFASHPSRRPRSETSSRPLLFFIIIIMYDQISVHRVTIKLL